MWETFRSSGCRVGGGAGIGKIGIFSTDRKLEIIGFKLETTDREYEIIDPELETADPEFVTANRNFQRPIRNSLSPIPSTESSIPKTESSILKSISPISNSKRPLETRNRASVKQESAPGRPPTSSVPRQCGEHPGGFVPSAGQRMSHQRRSVPQKRPSGAVERVAFFA